MSVELSGYSDDLLCVTGDINEEFDVYSPDAGLVLFSDATLATWRYDAAGMWRFDVVHANSLYKLVAGTDVDSDYTDRLTIPGYINQVVVAVFDGDDVRFLDSATPTK